MSTKVLDKNKTKDSNTGDDKHAIVVYNDDHNSFQHVIESFVDILDHSEQQAEQCAWLIHNKGKCSVKNGTFDDLRPKAEALIERGLSATIEDI